MKLMGAAPTLEGLASHQRGKDLGTSRKDKYYVPRSRLIRVEKPEFIASLILSVY